MKYIHIFRRFSIYFAYYMLNHRIRGLLFHYKKNCYFAVGLYFLVRVFTEHPDSVCENGLDNEQNVRAYYMPDL